MNKTLAISGTILTIVAISAYSQQAFAEETAPGLLVKEQLLSEEFLQTNSFLTFDSAECTTNESGPQACTLTGTVDKGNFIAAINHLHPGTWGQIMKFLMQILGNPTFDLDLSSFLTEGLNEEFASNTGNSAFLNPAVNTKLSLEETITNNDGQTTSQLAWSSYQEFQ